MAAVAGKLGRNKPYSYEEAPRVFVDNYAYWDTLAGLPNPTPKVSWTVPSWPMYLNDQLGDCTEAGKGHMIQALSAWGEGKELTVTDNQVEAWYERDGGYVPGDPSTDNGCVMQDVLNNWNLDDKALFPISEFAELKDYYSIAKVKQALYLFGAVYVGVNLPQSAVDQFNAGLPWTYVPGSPIAGGHAIVLSEVLAAGNTDVMHLVTWGQLQPASISWWNHYVEEAWVVLSPDWVNKSGVDPSGFNYAQLQSDFQQVSGGGA